MTWQEFEEMGRVRMAEHYGVPRLVKNAVLLTCGVVVNFDAVADDESVVGDFKSLTANPLYSNAGKLSNVSECVWLLQDVPRAQHRFVVFGVNRLLADKWLGRLRPRATGIEFFFLNDGGELTDL
jgi:hypothetical protein